MQQEQFFSLSGPPGSRQPEPVFDADAPQCCGTGCTVCVLDYPELFSGGAVSETLALLEAVEQAQAQVGELVVTGD